MATPTPPASPQRRAPAPGFRSRLRRPRAGTRAAAEPSAAVAWPSIVDERPESVLSGRTPILDQEGLLTPTDSYYIVTQLDMPEPVHPDDWSLTVGGEVEHSLTLSLADLRNLPGRSVRAVTSSAEGNASGAAISEW